jgi:hypothetical protein
VAIPTRNPRFKLGHRVVIIVSGTYRDRQAIVIEVIAPIAGDVYPYRVLFADGE